MCRRCVCGAVRHDVHRIAAAGRASYAEVQQTLGRAIGTSWEEGVGPPFWL